MNKIFALPYLYGTCFCDSEKCVCSYVNKKGKTELISYKKNCCFIPNNIYFLRGLEYLIFGFYIFTKNIFMFSNKDFKKNTNKTKIKTMLYIKYIFVLLFFIGLCLIVKFIPNFLSDKIVSNNNLLLYRFITILLRLLVLLIILVSLKCMMIFRQLYRFNACCNYVLNHNNSIHKGVNYLNFMLVSIILFIVLNGVLLLYKNTILNFVINLIILVFCFSISYELLLCLDKCKNNFFRKIITLTSVFVTEMPTKTELYVSLTAYSELDFMNNKKRRVVNTKELKDNEVAFSSVYAENKQKLFSANITDISELDWLICEVLNINRSQLRLKTKILETEKIKIEKAVMRRINGEPITKIFERTVFYGYPFKVTKDVLSPRMETEILVENVLKFAKEKSRILDLCTGSGAIAVSIAKNIDANIYATDISDKALLIAKHNAKINGVKINFKKSNLFENLKIIKKFDIIVSNPPYIPTEDIKALDVEVRDYDPKIALDGGVDGLKFYRNIINNSIKYLSKNGMIFLEIGIGQKDEVVKLLEMYFEDINVIKDYNKIDRVIYAKLKNRRK